MASRLSVVGFLSRHSVLAADLVEHLFLNSLALFVFVVLDHLVKLGPDHVVLPRVDSRLLGVHQPLEFVVLGSIALLLAGEGYNGLIEKKLLLRRDLLSRGLFLNVKQLLIADIRGFKDGVFVLSHDLLTVGERLR